jgi:hypothetical protein
MIHIKAPADLPDIHRTSKSIFLAGSIELGKADNWQERMVREFKDLDVAIYNPRRDDWDNTWTQSIDNEQFAEQVRWGLHHLERVTVILMYFDPNTKAPITLLELGLFAKTGKMIVCCPEGFYRKGNVDIVCERYGVTQVDTLDELVQATRDVIQPR